MSNLLAGQRSWRESWSELLRGQNAIQATDAIAAPMIIDGMSMLQPPALRTRSHPQRLRVLERTCHGDYGFQLL